MKQIVLIVGAFYGMISVILGALGAHAFKKILPPAKLESFEIGVKYMMYHAILLLILGFMLNFTTGLEKNIARLIMFGCLFFSGSIYLLSFSDKINLPTKILGPITPFGGLLMILGWAMLVFYFFKYKF